MAESVVIQTETQDSPDPSSSSISVLLHRKIEFLPAKKPFKGFSNDFHLETLNPTATATTSEPLTPSSAKKHDASEFSEFGLDPELSFGITFRKIGAGLQNLGNTCFLNSVIQCLTYTEPLAAYLQSGKHKNSCRIAGFCALCAIQNHVSRALQASGRILSPQDLVRNLRCISRNFRNARQEDAHEYMVNLLESMHKCCLPSGVPSESPGAYEKSLVHKIFGGRLRSQVKCQQCSYSSNKFDPFLDLSLEIFKADSLQKALANFTAPEWLDGGEKQYNCQRCKQKVRALKQLTIHKAPYVLTIHLKRFYAHDPGLKIKKKVHFGCALDLKPFVSGSYDGDLKYSLYGVLVHSGSSTHSGHYYCYVRTSNNMWYTLDDNRVGLVSEREVLNQQAYMLFYVRDRKSVVPRKPVDIAKEGNLKANVNVCANRDSSTSNQALKEVINGPVASKSSGESCLTAETQKNMPDVDSSRVSFVKDAIVLQTNSLTSAESLMLSKKPVSEPTSQPHKGSPEGLSVANSELECMPSVDHTGKGSGLPHDVKSLVAPAGDNITIYDENKISEVGVKNSLSAVPKNNPQTSTAKQNTDGTYQSQKNDFVTNVDIAAPQAVSTIVSNESSPITPQIESNNLNHQVGASATGSVCYEAGSKVCEGAAGCQELVLHESANRSLKNHNQKPVKKSKKKFLKYNATGMYFRSTYIFLSYLGPQKKNSKRNKCRMLRLKNPNKGKLDKHAFSLNVGPSTPVKADELPSVSSCFESRTTGAGDRPDANYKLNDKSPIENIVEGEFRKRIDMNCAVLATTMQVENISGCTARVNQFEAKPADGPQDGKRDQMHNSLMSMLTRGLQETVVASWDDIELPPPHSLEPSNDKIATIGYVGDEWDEDYDKGKRKKLRGPKQSFGGPNLFQEMASEKSRYKKAKLDRSSSGNAPFRI